MRRCCGAHFEICVLYSVFCVKKAECTGIRGILWTPDVRICFDEVLVERVGEKKVPS